MGITKRVTSVSLGCEAERQISEIQDAFAPTFASRSHMLRFLIGIMHRIIFGGASLEEFVRLLQGIHASNSYYTVSPVAGNGALKIGPKRVDSLGGNQAERPNAFNHQKRVRLSGPGVSVAATCGFSFPASSPYFRLEAA